MPSKEIEYPIDRIDSSDNTYRITTNRDVLPLAASIKKVGLLTPPFLFKKNTRAVIVSGFRRIEACRLLEFDKIPIRLLNAGNTSKEKRAAIAISENAQQREFNLIEISRAFCLLSKVHSDPNEIVSLAASLGIPSGLEFMKKVKGLCLLPEDVQTGILDQSISLPTALILGDMEIECARDIAEMFRTLKLSLNKQRDLLLWLEEIAKREDLTILDVIHTPYIRRIMRDPDTDRNRKSRTIRTYFRKRRYPNLVDAESRFTEYRKNMNLGPRVSLIPPKHFEGTDFTLQLRFNSAGELKDQLSIAQKILCKPPFDLLLKK